jgi:hypothetical protein
MDFLDISSLGVAYQYAIKIKHKFKQQNKWEFGSANPQQPKYGKGIPNSQEQPTSRKPVQATENKGNGKMKKDTGKWCDFHKIPWHNTDECRSKNSLVVELKEKSLSPDSESDSEKNKRKQIIDVEPTATIVTTTIQPEEPEDPEEGEHLFHSQMWVKGTPLHFIVDSGSQKNLISTGHQAVGFFNNTTPATIQHSGGFSRDEISSSANNVICPMTSIPSRMRYCVMFPHWKSVMFF